MKWNGLLDYVLSLQLNWGKIFYSFVSFIYSLQRSFSMPSRIRRSIVKCLSCLSVCMRDGVCPHHTRVERWCLASCILYRRLRVSLPFSLITNDSWKYFFKKMLKKKRYRRCCNNKKTTSISKSLVYEVRATTIIHYIHSISISRAHTLHMPVLICCFALFLEMKALHREEQRKQQVWWWRRKRKKKRSGKRNEYIRRNHKMEEKEKKITTSYLYY